MTHLTQANSGSASSWSATISDEKQPKIPYRLGFALCAGVLLWLAPYYGTATVLLPARVAVIDPGNKANIVAMLSVSAMIVATIANILIGAFSDLTRSVLGRRTTLAYRRFNRLGGNTRHYGTHGKRSIVAL